MGLADARDRLEDELLVASGLPRPVYLQHIPTAVVKDLDRRWALVKESGSVTAHKHGGKAVKCEHRDVGSIEEEGNESD